MEQFKLPFDSTPKTEVPPIQKEIPPAEEKELTREYLKTLSREELEELYFQKIGNHRFSNRTDDEVIKAILNPAKEIECLGGLDKITDVWADTGPTGK